MKLQTALVEIGKLSAASKRRLSDYQLNLSLDKDRRVFDDRLRDYLLDISKDGGQLVKYANEYLDSVGWNQSKYKPEHINEQVERFMAKHKMNRAWRRKFKHIKQRFINEVMQWKLKMLKYDSKEAILDALPRLDTHAGFSYILTGKRKKGDYTEELLENYLLEEAKARQCNSFNKPILIGSRTQASVPYDVDNDEWTLGESNDVERLKKTRLVSMMDIYFVLAESKFAKPFQHMLGRTDWYMGGKSDADILRLVSKQRTFYTTWTSLDYSKYDQSIPAWLIREAFDIVRAAFVEDAFDEELFTIIREDFIHKVFITADGLVEAHDGVPSGSMFTQIIDSVVNRLMIDTYMETKGITSYEMCIMGDDNLIFTNVDLDGPDMEDYLRREFGIEMNATKVDSGSCHNDAPLFLSRYWTYNGVYRHPQVLIAKMIYPERRREYDKLNFTPSMVVQSYFDSFRLGMDEIFYKSVHDVRVSNEKTDTSAGKWLTGLAAYQKNYAQKYNEFIA